MKSLDTDGFSLIEVTIAMGVVAVSLLTLFALLPVGLKTNQNSVSETAGTNMMTKIIADMRATPKATATSTQFGITFGSDKAIYFDSEAKPTLLPTDNSVYRATITFPPNGGGPKSAVFSHIRVSWPARASIANAVGSCEMFAAFDRD